MQDEFQALAANNTWQLTPLPLGKKTIVVNGYIKSNIILMALLSATKLELLPKGLRLDERLLALIVTWILTPRGSNHSVLTEEDLVYIYCIMKNIRINWIHIIKEHMQKAMRLSDYHYPYVVLISKFLLYFEVNLEDETSELVK